MTPADPTPTLPAPSPLPWRQGAGGKMDTLVLDASGAIITAFNSPADAELCVRAVNAEGAAVGIAGRLVQLLRGAAWGVLTPGERAYVDGVRRALGDQP
jgi:hypothetical protein